MKNNNLKWILVAGARPNFMKIGPLIRAIRKFNTGNGFKISPYLVHTGQHYDEKMSTFFFRDLDLPNPNVYLGVGSGNHGEQTGKILIQFEKILLKENPDLVIVVGDVNSTLACALAAVKLHIPIAHVEAGLRSFDKKMPEEINRILTDAISDYLFTPSPDGDENLIREGVPLEKIFMVGDIMVDSLIFNLDRARKTDILQRLGLLEKSIEQEKDKTLKKDLLKSATIPYALLTLHRPSNVDNKKVLTRILDGLMQVASLLPIMFPIHPRTLKQVKTFGLGNYFAFHASSTFDQTDYFVEGKLKNIIHCIEPLGYLEFLNLMSQAKIVLTDSGGIQEETTVLNIPCLTLRDSTERPITIKYGTNVLVKDDPKKIVSEAHNVLMGKSKKGSCPHMWDGRSADRIVKVLVEKTCRHRAC